MRSSKKKTTDLALKYPSLEINSKALSREDVRFSVKWFLLK